MINPNTIEITQDTAHRASIATMTRDLLARARDTAREICAAPDGVIFIPANLTPQQENREPYE